MLKLESIFNVPHAIFIPLFLLVPWLRGVEVVERGPDLCGECGYSLRGNPSGICPECGTPVE